VKADLLVRIDDRLLHGQVLLAWASHFEPRRIVLGDDEVAADPVRCALYRDMAESDVDIDVLSLEDVALKLEAEGPRTLLVLGSAGGVRRLVERGMPLRHLQIGGLHSGPHKKRLLDYVHLSAEDADALLWLLAHGVTVEAQDLPSHRAVPIDRAMLTRLWP
jgi:mannose/fructose/N-acetylgalactosamine-specific phosphotransferase system component IIB